MSKQNWGPKMAALPNDRWRRFVIALLDGTTSDGHGSKGHTAALKRAGWRGTPESLRVTAYRLSHDVRVQEAIQEEARKRLSFGLPMALNAIEEIVADPQHKDRLAAAKAVMDRAGLNEVAESHHTVEFIANDPAVLERVRQLAARTGVPVEKLIGRTAALALKPAPAEDAEFEEIAE